MLTYVTVGQVCTHFQNFSNTLVLLKQLRWWLWYICNNTFKTMSSIMRWFWNLINETGLGDNTMCRNFFWTNVILPSSSRPWSHSKGQLHGNKSIMSIRLGVPSSRSDSKPCVQHWCDSRLPRDWWNIPQFLLLTLLVICYDMSYQSQGAPRITVLIHSAAIRLVLSGKVVLQNAGIRSLDFETSFEACQYRSTWRGDDGH